MDVAAVGVHHVQHEGGLLPVLVLRLELRLALVEQDRARLALARRGEDDAPVGQIVRGEVVAFLGDDVGRDHAPQRARRHVVLPDVPGRLVLLVGALDQGLAHREDDLRAVVRRLDVADVAETAGDLAGDVDLGGGGRGAVAHVEVAALDGNRAAGVRRAACPFPRAPGA